MTMLVCGGLCLDIAQPEPPVQREPPKVWEDLETLHSQVHPGTHTLTYAR